MTATRLRELLDYDPETGFMTRRVNCSSNARTGDVVGQSLSDTGYRTVSVDGRTYLIHRLIWLWMTGEWPADQIDHRNGIREDNRWSNLRLATSAQNNQNSHRPRRNNRSGYLGVHWARKAGKWTAQIGVNGKTRHLGLFDTAQAAYFAYLTAKAELHPFATVGQS